LDTEAGTVHILRGIDLRLARGESLSIVGPSGSGKSSLLMVMGGLERATEGSVSIAGRDFAALDEDGLARLRREHVGILFQDFHLVPTMTAVENVAIPLELAGRRDALERAEAGLAAVSLDHRLGHYPGQLSGGEQQRVALARSLVGAPTLLLADEPTGNLDRETGAMVMDLVFELAAERGTTLVLVTHDPRLAERCSRRARLLDGRIENGAVEAR
jgi:putative ABC transport system ATP-binding protein